jgi:hypothetical protein
MSDVEDFSLLSDEEMADLERARRLIADEEWKAAYLKGWRERNEPWTRPPPASPPLSLVLIAHFAYLDRLIGGIRELDTAQKRVAPPRLVNRCRGGPTPCRAPKISRLPSSKTHLPHGLNGTRDTELLSLPGFSFAREISAPRAGNQQCFPCHRK